MSSLWARSLLEGLLSVWWQGLLSVHEEAMSVEKAQSPGATATMPCLVGLSLILWSCPPS